MCHGGIRGSADKVKQRPFGAVLCKRPASAMGESAQRHDVCAGGSIIIIIIIVISYFLVRTPSKASGTRTTRSPAPRNRGKSRGGHSVVLLSLRAYAATARLLRNTRTPTTGRLSKTLNAAHKTNTPTRYASSQETVLFTISGGTPAWYLLIAQIIVAPLIA